MSSPNQTSFRRGISGNPGGRPATADLSALARRYTADWMRGLVGVVRLPVCKENAPSIVAAARELIKVGYPGLDKGSVGDGPATMHLHLLAVSKDAAALLRGVSEGVRTVDAESWAVELNEPPLEDAYVPPLDERLPHEALPLWDAAGDAAGEADHEIERQNDEGNDADPGT